MKPKLATLPPKKTPAPKKIPVLRKFAVWHVGQQPEIIEGYSAVVNAAGVTIDQGEKKRVIKGVVMVTEPSEKMKFL